MQEVNNPLRPLVIRGGYRPVELDQITVSPQEHVLQAI